MSRRLPVSWRRPAGVLLMLSVASVSAGDLERDVRKMAREREAKEKAYADLPRATVFHIVCSGKKAKARCKEHKDKLKGLVGERLLEAFQKLAREASQDKKYKTIQKGGFLGKIKVGEGVPEYDEVIWRQSKYQVELGKVSDPISTEQGYALLLVIERGDEVAEDFKKSLPKKTVKSEAAFDEKGRPNPFGADLVKEL
eukprot:gnl/TRDRNA2_/TRDRNA2_59764_c0_seq1.p1 gnl/TRDRNA2_/TRDRNA2_59764_c0~~gnl/TRDRNA2_/TRDRNA2_59764_c0_seq1.p1  ORF type:complete len:198 (+),score=50.56 gnl/TRDRNA2_/TRDRNA2_59764_c0_seq1:43-636(+)